MAPWIFALLLILAPPSRLAALPAFPGWEESAEHRRERYAQISDAIAAATSDPYEVMDLVAVAYHESAFAWDVDEGPCYRGPSGTGSRCDAGRAVTIYQLHASGDEARRLLADRRYAARVALGRIRASRRTCVGTHGAGAAYAQYAAGDCARGVAASREIADVAARLAVLLPFRPE